MAKLILNDLVNLQNEQSAVNIVNNNSAAIEVALENTLSRDGTAPNQMLVDLDMNSNTITNVPLPINSQEAANKAYVDGLFADTVSILEYVDDAQQSAEDAAASEAAAEIYAQAAANSALLAGTNTAFLCPEALAVVVELTEETSLNEITLLNDLCLALRPYWDHLDGLWLFAAETESLSKINIIDPSGAQITPGGAGLPTFASNLGWTGNGTNSYLGTGLNPAGGTLKYQQNDAFACVGVNTDTTGWAMGMISAGYLSIRPNNGSSQSAILINTNSGQTPNNLRADGRGTWGLQRTSSTACEFTLNGEIVASFSQASTALSNAGQVAFMRSNTSYSSSQITWGCIGGASATSQDVRDIQNIVRGIWLNEKKVY